MAKMILASSKQGDFVFDPFLGSGTSAVVAEKLGRQWCGVDINAQFLCWARSGYTLRKKTVPYRAIWTVCFGSEIPVRGNEQA